MSNVRSKYFAFEMYEENLADNWLDVLKSKHIPLVISPLHNKDFTEDGQPKKSHYHVVVCYNSLKSLKQVHNDFDDVASNKYIMSVSVIKGYFRYLCHLDNPEKAQYSESDVQIFYGAPYDTYVKLNTFQSRNVRREVLEFISLKHPREFCEVYEHFRDDDEALDFIIKRSHFVSSLVTSFYAKYEVPNLIFTNLVGVSEDELPF